LDSDFHVTPENESVPRVGRLGQKTRTSVVFCLSDQRAARFRFPGHENQNQEPDCRHAAMVYDE